jgi:catechol 2,3-dioxygenase-like lactoylglutathione lyase family enzyme
MRAQLEFWSDVLGCPLRALYWMHGVPNAKHAFVELSGDSYIAFVDHPDNSAAIDYGVTHAGDPGGPVAGGAIQHVALHVDTFDEVLALRDRIRSRGVQVLGPIDHGFIQSMYFAGPEGLTLEVCCGSNIGAEHWIDPEVVSLYDISAADLARLKHPEAFERPTSPAPQPTKDPSKPMMRFTPLESYDVVMSMPDSDVWDAMSETTPPVA